jgi:hypothetical protein
MAATKKRGDGNGSNMGLIVTLVFFVLATVILGVMTYLGFADQDKFEKAKKDAEAAKTVAENDRNWYRFQARMLREYMGQRAAGTDVTDMVREKGSFDKGQLSYAGGDKAEVKGLFDKLEGAGMKWEAGKDTPNQTYESRLAEKDRSYAALKKSADDLQAKLTDRERQLKEKQDELEKAVVSHKEEQNKAAAKAEADRKSDRDMIETLRKNLGEENARKEKESVALAETRKALATSENARRKLQTTLEGKTKDARELKDRLDDTTLRYTAIAEKFGVNVKAAEAEALDARAREMLKMWNKPWAVVEMDRRGEMPYINLGSGDGLTTQVTFSVHSKNPGGGLVEKPKGTLEVVRIIGPHLAQARVTSTRDGKADPILKGDRLFNPTWDPNRKRHVAIAGIADLGGDGTDNLDDFRRLLQRQNVVLDAYIDTKDDKMPKVVGKGVTVNTDYLILADTLEAVNSPRSRDREYVQKYDRLRDELKTRAANNGVTLITLRRYLDMIGYTAPKVISTGAR